MLYSGNIRSFRTFKRKKKNEKRSIVLSASPYIWMGIRCVQVQQANASCYIFAYLLFIFPGEQPRN